MWLFLFLGPYPDSLEQSTMERHDGGEWGTDEEHVVMELEGLKEPSLIMAYFSEFIKQAGWGIIV